MEIFFSGNPLIISSDLEMFRKLHAFCGHDLRSQLGVVMGLLQLLDEDPEFARAKNNSSFISALQTSREALEQLDRELAQTRLNFKVIWVVGEIKGVELNVAENPASTSFVCVQFANIAEMLERLNHYRPYMLFIHLEEVPQPIEKFIRKVGPQMVRIIISTSDSARDGESSLQEIPKEWVKLRHGPLLWSDVNAELAQLSLRSVHL